MYINMSNGGVYESFLCRSAFERLKLSDKTRKPGGRTAEHLVCGTSGRGCSELTRYSSCGTEQHTPAQQ